MDKKWDMLPSSNEDREKYGRRTEPLQGMYGFGSAINQRQSAVW